jgi:hypothetical protein
MQMPKPDVFDELISHYREAGALGEHEYSTDAELRRSIEEQLIRWVVMYGEEKAYLTQKQEEEQAAFLWGFGNGDRHTLLFSHEYNAEEYGYADYCLQLSERGKQALALLK